MPWVIAQCRVPVELAGGRQFIVPAEGKTGWNWGDRIVRGDTIINDFGLMKYKGGDTRKRPTSQRLTLGV